MSTKAALRLKKHFAKRVAEGRCLVCGLDVDRPGKNCIKCAEKRKIFYREYRQRKRATGREQKTCNVCNDPRVGDTVLCEKHWFTNAASSNLGSSGLASALREKLERQGSRCYYTGRPLLIGVNAAVDHLLSVANHPELRGNIDNVVWCLKSINVMKNAMDEGEFYATCQAVLDHREER